MKKVNIEVQEKLVYTRNIEIEVPDDMDRDYLEELFNKMERDEFLGDSLYVLRNAGIKVGAYDEDLDSPYSGEVEVIDFDLD